MSEKMKRVFVCPVAGRESEIKILKAQIATQRSEVVCPDQDPTERHENCVAMSDILVVLICPESANDPNVSNIVEQASRLGQKIIGVHLNESTTDGFPPWIEREGDACVGMIEEDLIRAILEDEAIFTEPSGRPRPPQRVPRHKGH